jgi:tetratricopeptide (TPR) repeat protein
MPNLMSMAPVALLLISLTAATAADRKQWDECAQAQEPDASIAACTKILQADNEPSSNLPVAYYARAGAYKVKGENDRAISDYTRAIEANSLYADAYVGRGIVYQFEGHSGRAISDYSRAIEINPHYANAYVGRGMVYWFTGESDRALADYTKAIEITLCNCVLESCKRFRS